MQERPELRRKPRVPVNTSTANETDVTPPARE